ncbi:Cobalt-zinc-cadmium resistance protein CzcB [Planctomycetes bacterium Pla86]|uniref:Cobalt-zinc-cadmium resistance protein CzcB n=2 Tax=Engelhardtia mirabilis TaxID=2528011 RepID=A0A518BQA2_9BACT|nr:Cobalt-zinc-cadmium resistance protein CzcB [Planctomycetes bacterium Pla133]QDV03484.1 Cobalt-zinc-cadmium resistance protein CzcB [Planctomycetes bacterium Pla86]
MHPQISAPQAGACPLCGMDLVERGAMGGGGDAVRLGPDAAALAGVVTAPAVCRAVEFELPLFGRVELDASTVRSITVTVPGRIERLFVDSVGMEVNVDDHLYELYSPGLLSAQAELLSTAERFTRAAAGEAGFILENSERAYTSSRTKLRLWGLSEEQVDEIERSGEASDRVEFRSQFAGTVVEHGAYVGDYVHSAGELMRLADLSHLWVVLEAYERDLPFLRYGQAIEFEVDALPGQVFTGTISLIEPTVDRVSRTAAVRVHVLDPERVLKPGMYVRSRALVALDREGHARGPDLTGKWISPMHPEIVADGPGQCSVCGMDLVPAQELGLVGGGEGTPLVVPTSAVLTTGRRALVYVHEQDGDASLYRPREVRLGPQAGDSYVILEGLVEGEQVAVQGAFRLDSEMQIAGGHGLLSLPSESIDREPSRVDRGMDGPMDPARVVDPGHGSPLRHAELWTDYLRASAALAADDGEGARAAFEALATDARAAQAPDDLEAAQLGVIAGASARAAGASAIADQRAVFDEVSEAALSLIELAGNRGAATLRVAFCPMAFDNRGARWIQGPDGPLANPYFGASMLRCGVIEREVTRP